MEASQEATIRTVSSTQQLFLPKETLDHPFDVTLAIQDGKEFKAHRRVLSEASPFFERLLKSALMSRNACNGENGETGEKSPAAGDLNWMPKVAPWRLAILAKMAILAKLAILAKIARGLAICGKIFKLDAKSGPFKVDN